MSLCMKCNGPKSEHAQLCPWCEKTWDFDSDSIKMNEVITRVLSLSNLKPEYIDVLLAHEAMYEKAFTSKSYDLVNNYEILELLGDGIANSFLSWYFLRRFPNLDCANGLKVLARLKINYASKRSFSEISEKLGFWDFIRASPEQKISYRASLLEDVFEAFIGATVKILDDYYMVGVGYGIAYKILEEIFNNMNISIEYTDLYDYKTRLKAIFDHSRTLGSFIYEDQPRSSRVYRIPLNGGKIFMGEGKELAQKSERQQEASKNALKLFTKEESVHIREHNQLLVDCGTEVARRR